ncbi:MAG: OsmC family protein [Saprospiraceae bacterium]|nr:OsmC family protein [Saprospiraceae bacterium]MCB0626331.1 OsmC family protein [Saprospiraceae bacterium]MCB0678301.1 OsmC family protein [Saprospiraceae bacterium]MCB0684437.1 OsmC family protein [Saprospiraceae bacterium]
MQTRNEIKAAFDRKVNALSLRPYVGQGTARTSVRIVDGLSCEIQDGPWKLFADMSARSGGNGQGPDPGVLGRSALGSCLAISYVLWASRLEVPIDALEVDVEADYDARGMYGWDEVEAGYLEVRYTVRVSSPAPREAIMEVLDLADRHGSYLAVFGKPQRVVREVLLNP